jgi:hypothetical protein
LAVASFGITRRLASAPSGIPRRLAFGAVRHLALFGTWRSLQFSPFGMSGKPSHIRRQSPDTAFRTRPDYWRILQPEA